MKKKTSAKPKKPWSPGDLGNLMDPNWKPKPFDPISLEQIEKNCNYFLSKVNRVRIEADGWSQLRNIGSEWRKAKNWKRRAKS